MDFWHQFLKSQAFRAEYLWREQHPYRAFSRDFFWMLLHPIQWRRLRKEQRAELARARAEILASAQQVVDAAIHGFQQALLFLEDLGRVNDWAWEPDPED